jgi:hypothetical protein
MSEVNRGVWRQSNCSKEPQHLHTNFLHHTERLHLHARYEYLWILRLELKQRELKSVGLVRPAIDTYFDLDAKTGNADSPNLPI